MRFIDKFNYSGRIVNYIKDLSKIELLLLNEPKIQGLGLWLRKNALIKTVTYSNQIEGNSLNEKQVETIIQGKAVVGNQNDIQEAKNLVEAYEIIESIANDRQFLKRQDLLNLHVVLCKDTLPDDAQLGKIRTIDVIVGDPETNEIEYQPPSPLECINLMTDFFDWLSNQLKNIDFEPYISAALAHYYLVSIHPFVDGNGRISRLLQNYVLRRGNLQFSKYIPVETAIKRNQQKYYDALVITRKENDLHYFVEFILSMFIEEGNKLLDSLSIMDIEPKSKQQIQESQILLLFKEKKSLRARDLINGLSVSKATATRIFERMLKKELIIRVGNGSKCYYVESK